MKDDTITISIKTNSVYNVRTFAICLASVVIAIICGFCPVVREGMELLFLLPLAFAFCRFVFARTFQCWKDNLALTIIFASIYCRYLVIPLTISLSGTCLSTLNPSSSSYRMALFIQIFELFIALIAIDCIWLRYKRNQNKYATSVVWQNNNRIPADFRLSVLGFVFVIALILLVIVRGHMQNVFSHLSTWWSISSDTTDLYYYDLMAVDVVKNIIAITLISLFARVYHKSSSKFNRAVMLLLALLIGIASTMYFQYTQRTAIAQVVLSVLFMMLAFFPQKRKLMLAVFGIGGMFFVFYVFAIGTMRYEVGGSNENIIERTSEILELYVTGPTMVAISRDNYSHIVSNMSIATGLSDILNTVHIFGLFPFLRGITGLVSEIPTTNDLFKASINGFTYVMPNYSLFTYYFSNIFGWLVEVVSIFGIIKVICEIDKRKNKFNDACYHYAIAYTEVILGQTLFVFNSFLLVHSFTSTPLWLLFFFYVNRKGNQLRFIKSR